MKICSAEFDLIVSIVGKGSAEDVMDCAKKAGAEGGTILNGKGTGIHEAVKIFGIPFEPEKEVVLILIDRGKSRAVMQSIYRGIGMDKPGRGIIFVLDVAKVAGIVHLDCIEDEATE